MLDVILLFLKNIGYSFTCVFFGFLFGDPFDGTKSNSFLSSSDYFAYFYLSKRSAFFFIISKAFFSSSIYLT